MNILNKIRKIREDSKLLKIIRLTLKCLLIIRIVLLNIKYLQKNQKDDVLKLLCGIHSHLMKYKKYTTILVSNE